VTSTPWGPAAALVVLIAGILAGEARGGGAAMGVLAVAAVTATAAWGSWVRR